MKANRGMEVQDWRNIFFFQINLHLSPGKSHRHRLENLALILTYQSLEQIQPQHRTMVQ